jgi:hypothetical protein
MPIIQRQTFIALRARRQAHQIASQIINPSRDLAQVCCRECGRSLRRDRLDRNDRIACHRCGHVNDLPHELANRVRSAIAHSDCHTHESRPRPLPTSRRRTNAVQLISGVTLVLMLLGFLVLALLALGRMNRTFL